MDVRSAFTVGDLNGKGKVIQIRSFHLQALYSTINVYATGVLLGFELELFRAQPMLVRFLSHKKRKGLVGS